MCHLDLLPMYLCDNGVAVVWFRAGRELMTRYKGTTKTNLIERDFPHHVELMVPEGGFGKRLDEIPDWHRARGIQPMGGRGRRDENGWYVTWCFADAAMADNFRASFKRS